MVWSGCAGGAGVDALEGALKQWVDLRGEIATEQRTWREKEGRLQREIKLLGVEKTGLEEALRRSHDQASTSQDMRLELTARRERMTAALDGLRPALDRAEADLREFQAGLPAGLAGRMAAAFRGLPVSARAAEVLSVSRRMQVVMALYTELETLQHAIHVVKEVLPAAASPREVDVLYLGLSRGYAVAPDDTWAAAGRPGPDGWTWQSTPGIAGEVRRAVQLYRRERIGELVRLPVVLKEGQL